jgi:pyruvate/2-oxoglutarate dehydrogenase complex dihydrolipoamide dehydrogenase (E3) component
MSSSTTTVQHPEASPSVGVGNAYDLELIANVRPPGWENPLPRNPYHLLVIGAGPAGLIAARTAAMLGARVALIERDRLGGDSLNYASVPTKTIIRTSRNYADMRNAVNFGVEPPAQINLNFALAMDRVRRIRARISRSMAATRLTDLGVDLYFGAARFIGPDAVDVGGVCLRFAKAMVATGSQPKPVTIPGLTECGFIHTAEGFEVAARAVAKGRRRSPAWARERSSP